MRLIEEATIVEHAEFTAGYRRLVFQAPRIAALAAPGQFVHMRIPELSPEALRRPFSIYQSHAPYLHVIYKPVGRGTQAMMHAPPGETYNLIGPLGRGFPVAPDGPPPVFVAGGYGVAPLSFLAERLPRRGVAFIGGRTAQDILCVEDFASRGWDVRVTTEDGSRGERGRVTESFDRWVAARKDAGPAELFACGPEGLMRALGERTATLGWQAWVSLDRPMGCGIGACLACVQHVRDDGGKVAWARCCTEGPVFDAKDLVWDGVAP
ncbi:MAG: dihydroorotate dehydrogenase electron transfer subunit [Lentisphaerae bacterium]|nr:dihydroorotate dehydrogenase electron transfer subunit [Lentisphaerota bacterium]